MAEAARQEEEEWEYSRVLEMLKPEDRAPTTKAYCEKQGWHTEQLLTKCQPEEGPEEGPVVVV